MFASSGERQAGLPVIRVNAAQPTNANASPYNAYPARLASASRALGPELIPPVTRVTAAVRELGRGCHRAEERGHIASKPLGIFGPHEMARAGVFDEPRIRKLHGKLPLRLDIRLMVLDAGDDEDGHRQAARILEAVAQYSSVNERPRVLARVTQSSL